MKIDLKKIVIVFLIILLIFVCYSKYVKKEKVIKLFGKSILVVVSGSMRPTINEKELIIISEVEEYLVGDIVTFIDEEEMIITHRIIELNENTFVSKGDGNNASDGEYGNDSIQGKVVFHSKILGILVIHILKPLLIIYILIWIFLEVREQKKLKIKEEK